MKYNKTGVLIAEDILIKERLNICNSCEFLKDNKCMACGCDINTKISAKIEKCPKKHW